MARYKDRAMRNSDRLILATLATTLALCSCKTAPVTSQSASNQPTVHYAEPLMVIKAVVSPNPLVMSGNDVQGIVDLYFNHPTTDSGSVSVRARIPGRPWNENVGDQKYDSGQATVHVEIKFQLQAPATMPMTVHIFASSQNDYRSSLTVIQGSNGR
jgi:hypothetical protein